VAFIIALVAALFIIGADGVASEFELSAFYATFVMLQVWNLFNARVFGRNVSAFYQITENRLFLIIMAAIFIGTILIVQFGGDIFRTVPLTVEQWLTIILITSPVLIVGEVFRFYRASMERRRQTPQQQRMVSV
jgi:Ca2+-transporting ATPase